MLNLNILWNVADSIANCNYVHSCTNCAKAHGFGLSYLGRCPLVLPNKEIEEAMRTLASMVETCMGEKVNKVSEEYFLDLFKEEGEICSK